MPSSSAGVAPLAEEATAHVIGATLAVDPFLFFGLGSTAEQQLACARNWLRLRKVDGVERAWNRADLSGDRIRIAYLSGDFRRHAVANVISELFEIHDSKGFEILGVSFGPNDASAIRSRLVKSFDRFIDVTDRSDQDVARLLRDLKANIAVDLMGHTNYARIGILADRAAPVQVTYLGFPGTTGADFIDYIIGDETVLPPDQQPFFTEKFVHLPDSYQVNDSTLSPGSIRPSRSGAGLPDNALGEGDLLFFYTDGVTEARNAEQEFFDDRLADALAATAGRSAAHTVRAVQELVTAFSEDELRDDVTILAVKAG